MDGSEIVLAGAGSNPLGANEFFRVSRSTGGLAWQLDPVAPGFDTFGPPAAMLIDSAGSGILAAYPYSDNPGALFIAASAGAAWTSLLTGLDVRGLAGTSSDFWAVGAGIWHIVDGKVVETR